MAYQNNNNRLTPNSTGKLNINPVTEIVNKELKVQLDTTKAQQTKALAQGLASLGQGLISYDKLQQQQAQEKAIEMMYQDDIEGNSRHDWIEAQKKLKGLEKFNPHIKDSYKSLSAKDFMNKAIKDLMADPTAYAKTSQEMEEIVAGKKAEFNKLLTELNIPSNIGAKYLLNFNNVCDNYLVDHASKNAEWTYNLSLDKHSAELGKQIRTGFYNVPKEQQGAVINTVLSNFIAEYPDIPQDDLVNKVIVPMAIRTVKGHTSPIEQAEFINALKTTKVGNCEIQDLVPDLELTLRDTFKTVALEALREEEEADKQAEKELKKRKELAEGEFFKQVLANPNLDMKDLAAQLVTEYGIEAKYDDFLTTIVNYKTKSGAIDDVSSDEELLKRFDIQLGLRQLDQKELTYARLTGKISRKDYLDYLTRDNQLLEKANKAEEKQSEEGYKATLDETIKFANNIDTKKKLRDIKTADGNTAYEEYHRVVADVNTLVKTGELSKQEGITRLQAWQEYAEEKYLKEKIEEINPQQLMRIAYTNNLEALKEENYDVKSATNAFKASGMFKMPMLTISSGIKDNRTITYTDEEGNQQTKTSNHQAYDIKATQGTPIYGIGECTLVAKAYNKDAGNMALVRINATGDYMVLRHLAYLPTFKTGQTIPKGVSFAAVGNTGISTGSHLDVQFYSKDCKKRLTVEQTVQRYSRKRNTK